MRERDKKTERGRGREREREGERERDLVAWGRKAFCLTDLKLEMRPKQ